MTDFTSPCPNCAANSEGVDSQRLSDSDVIDNVILTPERHDDDDDDDTDVPEYQTHYQNVYQRACSMFKVTPSNYFLKHLSDLDVSMQDRVVGDVGAKAIATALVVSCKATSLQILDLDLIRHHYFKDPQKRCFVKIILIRSIIIINLINSARKRSVSRFSFLASAQS